MRILVVEDNPEHMKAAVKTIQAAGHEVIQATNFWDGKEILTRTFFEAVITDLFIPAFKEEKAADQPCGLGIALVAEKRGVPWIICTAGYHHGSKYNWICELGRYLGWPEMADPQDHNFQGAEEVESPTKDWAWALESLKWLMKK